MRGKSVSAMIGLLWSVSSFAQAFDNNAIISLQNAGLGEATLVTKVNSLPCGYDVSTGGLISLKRAEVPDAVIAAMVSRCTASSRAQGADNESPNPAVKHSPGIYMMQDWLSSPKLLLIRPAIGSGTRMTGNGSILFPLKQLTQLPSERSQNRSYHARPTFYFYFNADDRNVSDFGVDRSISAQSPSEFNLVKFKIKNNAREIETGRASAYFSVNVRKGVSAKDATAFSADEIGDGIFRVSANADMPVGEYAFVFSGENGRSRVYDFGVDAAQSAQSSATATR